MTAHRILVGDARVRLGDLADDSVHCVVTSPPYWGLRAYRGDDGMIGMEDTFDEHLANLLDVFAEVARVMRSDGTLWLNYGDAYAGSGTTGQRNGSIQGKARAEDKRATPPMDGCKPKDLMMMPARIALALQAQGWYLRSEIVWAKPNPMPESVTDRPTSSHEKIWLLSRQPRYYYDADAVRLPAKFPDDNRKDRVKPEHTNARDAKQMAPRKSDKQRGHSRRHAGFNDPWDQMTVAEQRAGGANLRNVWQIATRPFRDAHFATFPPDLSELCIKAGTSEQGVCAECGQPYRRVTDVAYVNSGNRSTNGPRSVANRHETAGYAVRMDRVVDTISWSPMCFCPSLDTVPAVVLDPFGGAGTVSVVAENLGRDSVLVEVSSEYAELARKRITDHSPMFAEVDVA